MFHVSLKIVAYNVSHNNQAAGQAANILPLWTINSPCTFVFHSVNGWIIFIGLRVSCFLPSNIVSTELAATIQRIQQRRRTKGDNNKRTGQVSEGTTNHTRCAWHTSLLLKVAHKVVKHGRLRLVLQANLVVLYDCLIAYLHCILWKWNQFPSFLHLNKHKHAYCLRVWTLIRLELNCAHIPRSAIASCLVPKPFPDCTTHASLISHKSACHWLTQTVLK